MPPSTKAADKRTKRSTRLRMRYTGEVYRMALDGVRKLGNGDRLIPAPTSVAQQELEALVLLGLRDARRARNVQLPFYPFDHIIPKLDSLELLPVPHMLGPLAFALAPRPYDDPTSGFGGIPGLRVSPGDSGMVVSLLDQNGPVPGARVLLRKVTPKQWSSALAWADDQYGSPSTSLVHDSSLSQAEGNFLRHYGLVRVRPALASLMLRRLHVLSDAQWIDVWTADGSYKIEWADGPALAQVALQLIEPQAGLLGTDAVLRDHDRIRAGHEPYALDFRHGGDGGGLFLRRLQQDSL
ncbi:hypothetical protein [Amycolatopsis sp. NPDC059021]|uniref:hypothetical protein n=1 Tax=Amycolatopsis sp. NPDC059021 TaxID=3346704 RepID=UPI00366E02EA